MAEPSNSIYNIAANEVQKHGGRKRGIPPNANPNVSPAALMTLTSCIPDQKLQSVSAPSQGVSALQPSKSPSPSMARQQQLTSLLLPLLGMSSSQVQQPSSLAAPSLRRPSSLSQLVRLLNLIPCYWKTHASMKVISLGCLHSSLLNFEGKQVNTPTPSRKKKPTLRRWLSAFVVYCTVLLTSFPHRAGEMFAYQEIIQLAHCKLIGFG